jgi:hypothetical protein
MEATAPGRRKVELAAVELCGKNLALCHSDTKNSYARAEISQRKIDELTR